MHTLLISKLFELTQVPVYQYCICISVYQTKIHGSYNKYSPSTGLKLKKVFLLSEQQRLLLRLHWKLILTGFQSRKVQCTILISFSVFLQLIQEFNQQLFMQENPVFHKAHDFQFQPSECDTVRHSRCIKHCIHVHIALCQFLVKWALFVYEPVHTAEHSHSHRPVCWMKTLKNSRFFIVFNFSVPSNIVIIVRWGNATKLIYVYF